MQIMTTAATKNNRVSKIEITEVKTDEDDSKQSQRAQILGSGFGATINLISTAIGGGGMFGNIFGASQLGICGFVLITLISTICTYLSIEFLVMAANISHKKSCYQLSEQYLGGKKGNLLTKIFIIFGNWTFVINTIQIFADFVSDIIPVWFGISDESFFASREFAVILGLIFIFPWVQSKTIKSLEKLSGAFVLLCLIILLIIIVNAFKASLLNDVAPSIQLGPTSFVGFFRGLPAITWCWTIQFNVLPVYNTLDEDNRTRQMSSVSYWSCVSLFCYYVIFGFAVLIIWGNKINTDFMTNLDSRDQNYVFYYGVELSTTTQFIMCIVTFASIPIFAFEARTNSHYIIMDIYYNYIQNGNCCSFKSQTRHQRARSITDYAKIDRHDSEANIDHEETPLMSSEHSHSSISSADIINDGEKQQSSQSQQYGEPEAVAKDYTETWKTRLVESGTIIITAAIAALYLTNLNWCLSLVGATYGCYIAYFVPSIVYWKAVYHRKKMTVKMRILQYLAVVSIVYGIVVCVLGVTMAFV